MSEHVWIRPDPLWELKRSSRPSSSNERHILRGRGGEGKGGDRKEGGGEGEERAWRGRDKGEEGIKGEGNEGLASVRKKLWLRFGFSHRVTEGL